MTNVEFYNSVKTNKTTTVIGQISVKDCT